MIALTEVDFTMSARAVARTEQHPPTPGTESIQPVSQAGPVVAEEEYWRDDYFESDIHYEGEFVILHREPEHQAFYTLTTAGGDVPLAPEDGVIRYRVPPGLQFRQDDLIAQPALEEMRREPAFSQRGAGFMASPENPILPID
jgi:hypothetical protein